MNRLQRTVTCLFFLINGSVAAIDLNIKGFQLISISGTSDFNKVQVWSGLFVDYSGRAWDTSHLYRNKRAHLNLEASVLQKLSDRVLWMHGFTVDNGYKSPLFEMTPEFGYHPSLIFVPNRSTTLSIHLFGFFRSGGASVERPCVDGFDREFHCGTGLPWSDSQGFHIKTRRSSVATFSARFVF